MFSKLFPVIAFGLTLLSAAVSRKIIVGSESQITLLRYHGEKLIELASVTEESWNPSWLEMKNRRILYAVDENSDILRMFRYSDKANKLFLFQKAHGSKGVTHLALSKDGNHMLGAAYGNGSIDVWDISDKLGRLKLIKQITITDAVGPNTVSQTMPHPHQSILDQTGRFFAVPDLGTDSIHIISTANNSFDLVNSIKVDPPGNGPRHGAFYPPGAFRASHFLLVSQLTNVVTVFEVQYRTDSLEMTQVQQISTYGNNPIPSSAAAAAELIVSSDGNSVYVTNRANHPANKLNTQDTIAHYTIGPTESDPNLLQFQGLSLSGGQGPRHAFLDPVQDLMLVSNTGVGGLPLAIFPREREMGGLGNGSLARLTAQTGFEYGPSYARFVDTYPLFKEGGGVLKPWD